MAAHQNAGTASMQDVITAQLEQVITSAGLTVTRDETTANTGTMRAMRGLETVLSAGYGFFDGYATIILGGPAVAQAPAEFLTAQHALRHNRICRGAIPEPYDQPLSPRVLADRRGLSVRFHYLRYDEEAEIRELLDVVAQLAGGGDLTIRFSVVHWYEIPVRSAVLDEITGGLPVHELRGPVEDGFDDEDTEDAVAEWLTALAAQHQAYQTDGFEIHDVTRRDQP